DLAAYYIHWKDSPQVLFQLYSAGGQRVAAIGLPFNGEDLSGPGVDFGIHARLTDALNFGLSGGWNHLRFDADVFARPSPASPPVLVFSKGDRTDDSAAKTFRADLDYTVPVSGALRMRFAAGANYISAMTFHDTTTGAKGSGDAYWLGDASIAL